VNFSNATLAGGSVANYTLVGLASTVTTNANITPLLMAPNQVLQLTGAVHFANFVSFKMPVFEFAPLLLSAPNVELETVRNKADNDKRPTTSNTKGSIVESSIWNLDLFKVNPEKPSSIDEAAQAKMTGWTPAKQANPINVSYNMNTTLVANPNSK
jgi:hypothetical protein